jgi:hypothetical protein
VVPIGVDGPDRFDFLPRDGPRYQSMIENSALVDREDDHTIIGAAAEAPHENCSAAKPYQAKPFHEGNGRGEGGRRRRCDGGKDKACNADLGVTPHKRGAGLVNRLRSFSEIKLQ